MTEKAPENNPSEPGAAIDLTGLNRPLSFVLDVQQRLESSNKEQYDRFLAAFTKYRESLASTDSPEAKKEYQDTMKAEVKSILAGHDDLISEFEALTTL